MTQTYVNCSFAPRLRKSTFQIGSAALLAAACLLPLSGCKSRTGPNGSTVGPKANTTEYSTTMQGLVASPQAGMLQRADFSDDQSTVQQFYTGRNWSVAWTRDGKPTKTAAAMMQLFAGADMKGLRPDDYDGPRWQQHLQDLSAHPSDQNAVAQFDMAMTVAAVRYLDDLHLGRINPQSLNFDIDVPAKRKAFNVASVLNDQLVDSDDPAEVVQKVEPQNAMYQATEKALSHYLELAAKETQQPPEDLPAVNKAIAPGGSYPGMQPLGQRLALEGDGTPQPQGDRYTPEFAEAVQHFQSRVGLKADGKLGKGTVDALNVPMSQRVQQIDDSLERWRWLPAEYMHPRVLINVPEFYVRTFTPDGSLDFKMKTIVGAVKGNHDTPIFVRMMKYVVFRPYWNLPVSIVKKDLVRHVGSGYLESHGYEVVDRGGHPVTQWDASDLEHSRYLVRQKPGPKNSLGLVKFMFPNEYDIYMHSTPEMYLFNLTNRDRSHGCVRLHDPEKMANWVLDGQGDWGADKIHQAMYGEPQDADNPDASQNASQDAKSQAGSDPDSGATSTSDVVKNNHQVNLKTQLPVVITYLTAVPDEDGTMHFYDDLYGYDKDLQTELSKPRPYDRKPVKINPKLTPGETV